MFEVFQPQLSSSVLDQKTVVLTGGWRCDFEDKLMPSAQTHMMQGLTPSDSIWGNQGLPDLIMARQCHTSCSIGHRVYVFCGMSAVGGQAIRYIETLDVEKECAWRLLSDLNLTQRTNAAVTRISNNEILIMGGNSISNCDTPLADGFVYNT